MGLRSTRDRLLRIGLTLFLLTLFVPYAVAAVGSALSHASLSVDLPTDKPSLFTIVLVVVGHVALAIVLLRRRFGGVERARLAAGEIDRARGRERVRIPPNGGGGT